MLSPTISREDLGLGITSCACSADKRFFSNPVYSGPRRQVFSNITGGPLLLAIGFLFGVPWLVQPFLAAVSVLLLFDLARRQYSTATALLAVIFVASSPFLSLMSGSFRATSLSSSSRPASCLRLRATWQTRRRSC